MDKPHVIVMANCPPCPKFLTRARLDVMTVPPNPNVVLDDKIDFAWSVGMGGAHRLSKADVLALAKKHYRDEYGGGGAESEEEEEDDE